MTVKSPTTERPIENPYLWEPVDSCAYLSGVAAATATGEITIQHAGAGV